MEDDTLSLSDQIKIVSERLRILDEWVALPGCPDVHQLITPQDLLTCLDTHLHARDQDLVLGQSDISFTYNEPLTSTPLLVHAILLREIKATLHADNWLLILAHGKLLQVVVGLEKHITNTGARQPFWLKPLHLHPVLVKAVRRLHGVQGKHGLSALVAAHFEGNRQILQVDSCCWLDGRPARQFGEAFVCLQATHSLGHQLAVQFARMNHVAGDAFDIPANVVLVTAATLQG
mmetsp:Transcript_123401/g.230760  ORF Transcript_123401/g.230760 Transcript_123401/m.230760 type:complete len:233 (+) Transcript_123401:587-1285(+)